MEVIPAMIDIAALRKKLGMSAVELAAAIDVTPGFISQVENGKSGVSTDTAAKLARALGCTCLLYTSILTLSSD